MPRTLLAANLVLLAACALFVALMIRSARTPWPAPEPARPRPPAASPAAGSPGGETPPSGPAYSIIATRNLFSPTRSEAPPAPTTPVVILPKPNLYGVIVREGASIAYLEDPVTKRVAGYREGDSIAGGTVQTISNEKVVLARPDGNVDVRLHDPSKPRPAAPPAAGPPGAPARSPVTAPGAQPAQPGGAAPTAEAPSGPRRALPPSLLRRLPQSGTTNAPQQ